MKALILSGEGLNCEVESQIALEMAGFQASTLHVRDLFEEPKLLSEADLLFFIGGFSFGDHLGAGNALAKKFEKYCYEELRDFIEQDKLVVGVCNGFQVLVKLGFFQDGDRSIALAPNQKLKFESRWVHLKAPESYSGIWFDPSRIYAYPIRHGEGRFCGSSEGVIAIRDNQQIALQYCSEKGKVSGDYPENPNGSELSIAAIENKSGNVLGMMPHPEAFLHAHHHPLYHELNKEERVHLTSQYLPGWKIFENARLAREGNS